jgi:hypothetical protein
MFQFLRRIFNNRIGVMEQPPDENNMINMRQPQETFLARELRERMEIARLNEELEVFLRRERERNEDPIQQVFNLLRSTAPIVPIPQPLNTVQRHLHLHQVRRPRDTIYSAPIA